MPPIRLSCAAVLFSAVLASPVFGSGGVLVVDDDAGSGVDYTSIAQAASLAAPNTKILVRSGNYGHLVVSGKTLEIIADPQGGSRPIIESVRIDSTALTQHVVLRGFDVVLPIAVGVPSPIELNANVGKVLLEDVTSRCDISLGLGSPGMWIANSARVSLVRCDLEGSQSALTPFLTMGPAGTGVNLQNSTVAFYDCDVRGGAGEDASVINSADASKGGAAVSLLNGDIFFSGCTVTGGEGGDGAAPSGSGTTCLAAGDGGPGVELSGTGPEVIILSSTIVGGTAGVEGATCPQVVVNGSQFVDSSTSGQTSTIAETHRSYTTTTPVREGQYVDMTFEGEAGEFAVLLFGYDPHVEYQGSLSGFLVPQLPFFFAPLGVVPASGEQSFHIQILPILPASVDGITIYEQVGVAGLNGTGLLSSSSVLTVVRSGF